ncbi:MAG TPA: hypothetical protein PLK31_09945, partial [Chloroflexota bacterium]|nr:hypothetical protein [Chloroflexota bacterium]
IWWWLWEPCAPHFSALNIEGDHKGRPYFATLQEKEELKEQAYRPEFLQFLPILKLHSPQASLLTSWITHKRRWLYQGIGTVSAT